MACVGVFGRGVDVAVGGVEIGPQPTKTNSRDKKKRFIVSPIQDYSLGRKLVTPRKLIRSLTGRTKCSEVNPIPSP